MDVLLAQPRGFCAGVVRAVEIVERALQLHGAPVHVFHEIVHNGHVVADLRSRGAVFVDRIDEVPVGAVLVFSAHGVATSVERAARERRLRVIDATCPLVTKVHLQAQRYAGNGRPVIIIGHRGHDEVEGTLGSIDGPALVVSDVADVHRLSLPADAPVAYVTQTTLSVDDTREVIGALEQRFSAIQGPQVADICYATQNRQNAVRELSRRVDLLLVVGARNSSNSCRLQEVARQCGVAARLIQQASEIDPAWLTDVVRIGVTAGASTPEALVIGVCQRLMALGADDVQQMAGEPERVHFRLPPGLEAPARHDTRSGLVEPVH
ncbi:4-hydroxy-3-methylbut-2-enyl diphosphate reductase [Ideonella sp. A 288]|uniref:4-hydroxy-3-methylbut-2-enyl diphosphate reductase n=1 Tax=Ideonella sp. A 288 TaxID=1962181 RepID=UPI000B4AA6DE|nr:4-hydroxy-3-methylbut-2-enyl diphosphate reductase [Ideonella sp. A 288]